MPLLNDVTLFRYFVFRRKLLEYDFTKERNAEFIGTYVTKSDDVSSTPNFFARPCAPSIQITPPKYDDIYN